MDAFWIILTGTLAGASCALIGSFLVLRKMSMLGDAISHAVLPGIVIAFLITGSRSSIPMLLGAAGFGLLTAFLVETLHRRGRLQQDASIGVTFTWLFAIGVILISRYAGMVDLDQDCVLYGEIAYITFDMVSIAGMQIPSAVLTLAGIFLLNIIFVLVGYKELKITAFDSSLAVSLGISATFWHYALMGMVSLTTVGAFWSVGAILVVAMLIAPSVTAWLLTDRLHRMLIYGVLLSLVSAVGGYYLASLLDGSIAGAMAVVSGILFTFALFFSPTHGILSRRIRMRRMMGRAERGEGDISSVQNI
ncbi:MAG: metal ABC transporter permease [Candidatus Kapaibacterium sp.]